MSVPGALPFPVGAQSSSAVFAPLVGQKYQSGDNWYRLCRAGATDLLVNSVVTTAYSSGDPTFVVSATTLAADPDVVGVVPAAYTSGVTASNYFLVQISGAVDLIAGDTVVVKLSGTEYRLVTFTVASGQCRLMATFTTASTTEERGIFAFATNTAVATAIGQTITGVLDGLISKF